MKLDKKAHIQTIWLLRCAIDSGMVDVNIRLSFDPSNIPFDVYSERGNLSSSSIRQMEVAANPP